MIILLLGRWDGGNRRYGGGIAQAQKVLGKVFVIDNYPKV